MKYGEVQTEKLYFSSSEAAKMVGVPASVLHSWEKEFTDLKPKINANGKRIYRQNDIEVAKGIKEKMVNGQGPTIMAKNPVKEKKASKEFLFKIRDDLQSALNNLLGVHRN